MQHLHFPSSLDHIPIRLTDSELQDPEQVIDAFFSNYHLNDSRMRIAEWLVLAFSADFPELNSGAERNNLLFFSYQLEALIEATYVLNNKSKGGMYEINT